MTWALLGLLLIALWWLWEIRRTLGIRKRPRLVRTSGARRAFREGFKGAVAPNRFVVVRWPDGLLFYEGARGALARECYDRNHPSAGEEFELWENGDCRGHK